jgi:protoporphyrinogen oxidase
VYVHGRLIAAPIQRNVHRLPRSEFVPIVADLIRSGFARTVRRYRRTNTHDANEAEPSLDRYLNETFGRELTRRVMAPLNHKMWTLQPHELSSVWVRARSGSALRNVAELDVRRLLRHTLANADDPSWDETTLVRYPAHGGMGSVWRAAADEIGAEHVRFGARIVAVHTRARCVDFADGSAMRYSHLISTMPLDSLLGLCVDRPDVADLAQRLRRSGALLFGFGVEGSLPERYTGVHSFQCPEPDLPFWRVTIPSNVSPGTVPDARSYAVLCEISCDPSQLAPIDERLRHAVRSGLERIGLLRAGGRIVSTFEHTFSHGYPLPFLGRDAVLAQIHRQLEACDIFSRGRFGGWRYEVSNQDYAFAQGAEVVRRILRGEPERTYLQAVDA